MPKSKKNRKIVFILVVLEIILGVLVAHFYLANVIEEKNILKVVGYSLVNANAIEIVQSSNAEITESEMENPVTENPVTETESSEAFQTGEDISKISAEKEEQDLSNITIEVVDTTDAITGNKISIKKATSSSHINQEGHSNTAYEAYDGDLTTSWQEGVDGAGEGSWLRFRFDGEQQISSIVFYLGIWREVPGKDYYHNNHRPKEIKITIGDMSWVAEFSDEKIPHTVKFSEPVSAKKVTFTILSVYDTQQYADTGIADISIYE